MVLPYSFYSRAEVVTIARELLGKVLFTRFNGITTSAVIYETEAYNGVVDKASHAFGGRRTARTEIMYRDGGTAYVYLCYGIHSLFNVVTNKEDIPHAVLVRAVKPLDNMEVQLKRAGKTKYLRSTGDGPGKVCTLLGIHYSHSGLSLLKKLGPRSEGIWIEDRGIVVKDDTVAALPRIGVQYAGEDAMLPYRFRTELI
jgi:DNA-3-methyladenine glycosylase